MGWLAVQIKVRSVIKNTLNKDTLKCEKNFSREPSAPLLKSSIVAPQRSWGGMVTDAHKAILSTLSPHSLCPTQLLYKPLSP
jgi:hypothetical protein